MPLILAIEPSNPQAQQLASLVRQYLRAELVTAPSAKAALQALGDRIPDLILTPALLGPKDEAALTERLRELGNAAAHVQTLAVPILAAGRSRPAISGLLGRKRDKSDGDEPVGCQPSVFAEQIQIYLQRAASERNAVAGAGTGETGDTVETVAAAQAAAGHEESLEDDDTLDVIFDTPLAPPANEPPAIPATPAPEGDARASHAAATGRDMAPPAARPPQTRAAMELGLLGSAADSTPLWRIAEDVEDFYRGTASFAPATAPAAEAAIPLEAAPADAAATAIPLSQPSASVETGAPGMSGGSETVLELDLDEAIAAAAPANADAPAVAAEAGGPGEAAPDGRKQGGAAGAAPVVTQEPQSPPRGPQQKTSRRKKGTPPPDDWACFDPSQSPFKALIRRLEEIAGHAGAVR